jgi:drug/metabolite transporter (DMT)-like permease
VKAIALIYWKPLLAVTLWGASFIATKYALSELNPLTVILLRLFLGIVLLSTLAVYARKDFSISIKNHRGILLLALIAVFHLWIQVTGLQFTTASNTGWIIGFTPVFMALLAVFVFKEKITIIKTVGILIAFFGLLLLMSKGDLSSIDLISNKGDFLVLASALTWSVYSMVNKKVSVSYSPLMTILYLFIMMAVVLLPFTVNAKNFDLVLNLSGVGWVSILFLGIFCSGVAYVLWAQALQEMESSKVGAFLYFEPFVTVFAAWLLLKEEITLLIILSGVIITFGVLLVNIESHLKFYLKNFRK